MRGQQMIRRAIRSGVTALAVAFLAVPQLSIAQSANAQAQVDPLMAKAARIKNMNSQMRITQAQRVEAAKEMKANVERVKAAKAAARAKGIEVPDIGIRGVRAERVSSGQQMRAGAARSTSATALPVSELPAGVGPIGPLDTPDYFTISNWAFSPMLRKFVDTLPGLGSGAPNNLGNFIPVAHPDTSTYPGSDYYEISLKLYTHRFHSDLPPTNVRGYVQTNMGTNEAGTVNDVPPDPINWLGPVIIATKDRPIRVKFKNELPAGVPDGAGAWPLDPATGQPYPGGEGGNLTIPVDESIQGAGKGPMWPDGTTCDPTPPGVGLHGANCALFPQTRAAIHLHGGRTPWISDGTPHQWILPAADRANTANPYKQGVSLYNVPDMPVPGPDETTYYWSNQQSARLMFYHDHAWGITRLNVLAGEAAGLLLTDPTEQALAFGPNAVIPGYGTPLVIQDRTFVDASVNPLSNPPNQIRVRETDPTWNFGSGIPVAGVRPPVTGDFWMPHVYIVAQNPYTPSGVNAFGRWVYGPWFFPPTANLIFPPVPNPYHDANCSDPDPAVLAFCTTPNQPPVIPGTPLPSVGAETFFDTAIVNGQAFPVMDVEPKPYRFRILNAANDRFVNLNIYEADSAQITHAHWGGLPVAQNTEVEMCAVPGAAGPAGQVCWDAAAFPNWPSDGRVEGVPNPAKLGPDIIYIGTEGGFLPKPVVLKGQPLTWVGDPTFFNAGNIDMFNLFIGPAERADVIIDFSAWGGKELIFYNDASAAVPAFDPRFDYVTGAPDMSDSGGYGRVPPWNEAVPGAQLEGPQVGYGPNTRTVMKFRVAAGPGSPFDLAALQARWAPGFNPDGTVRVGVFQDSQDDIIVGQADYDGVYPENPTFPSVWPAWGLARIEDTSLMFETVAGTIVTFPMEPKAMHDEMGASFDKEYARMSTNLGTQLSPPLTNNANMTPFMYTDPATEFMNAAAMPISPVLGDGTQLWKISHNGVDMHPIHFHIFDVQVINRVGWDGMIRLPAPQELGWKDTVRIAPLEDTIVAMRPWTPPMPFSIPFSTRPLNPAIPLAPNPGSAYGFTNVDPITQGPLVPPTTNVMTSFAWEYVWHCHILSHEENDMMRAIVLNVVSTIPPAFSAGPGFERIGLTDGFRLTWADPTPVTYTETGFQSSPGFGNPASEYGFRIEREGATPGVITALTPTARANQTTFDDTTTAAFGTYYRYRVVAFNEAGETASPWTEVRAAPATVQPTAMAITVTNAGSGGKTQNQWTKSFAIANTVPPNFLAVASGGTPDGYEYQFEFRPVGGVYTVVQPWSAVNTWTMPANTPSQVSTFVGPTHNLRVSARNSVNGTPFARVKNYRVIAPATVTALALASVPAASPQFFGTAVAFTATPTGGAATKQYQYSRSSDGGLTWTVVRAWNQTATGNLWTMPATTPAGNYQVKVDVRTNGTVIDQSATVPFTIRNRDATGVTLTSSPTGATVAPPVNFLATGSCFLNPPTNTQRCTGLTTATGGGYYYQFSRSFEGGPFTVVQPYGTGRVYTIPLADINGVPTPSGSYKIRVDVTTSVPNADQVPPVFAEKTVSVQSSQPATAVTLTQTSVIPTPYGSAATFTASASGGAAGATYRYRFSVDNGATFSTWGTIATFSTPTAALGGVHNVLVQATTAPAPAPTFIGEVTANTNYTVVYPAATGVGFTSIVPGSPQPVGTSVTFTAAGSSSMVLPASAYQYQFSRSTDGTTWTDLQPWSASATYNMVGNVFEGFTLVRVDVTTEAVPATVQASFTTNPGYGLYGLATAVGWAPGSPPATPQIYGNAVTFVATASGGGPAVPGYQYRFLINGTEVQGWSANASYFMNAATLGGIYNVRVEATTAAAPVPQSTGEVFAETQHVIIYPDANGVTVSANPPGGAPAGSPVTFTAVGSSLQVLPPSAYKYRFRINDVVIQDWSGLNTFLIPNTTPPGAFTLLVEVSTQNSAPYTIQGETTASYTMGAWPVATGVTLTSSLPSPQPTAPQITFTAVGSSSVVLPPSAYQYRFQVQDVNGWRIVQNWGPNNVWTLLAGSTAGYYNVVVDVRTGTSATTVRATRLMFYGYAPATSITIGTSLPSPQAVGTAVTFTATAGPGPGPYQYQFLVYRNGVQVATTVYGASNAYTLLGTSAAGSYQIIARARGHSTSIFDVQTSMVFVIQ